MESEPIIETLQLCGRIQMTIARDALRLAGLSPATESMLSRFIKNQFPSTAEADQEFVVLNIACDESQQPKLNILRGLELLSVDTRTSPSVSGAAQALLSILSDS